LTANLPPGVDAAPSHGLAATTDAAQLSRLRDLLSVRSLEVDLELTLERRVRAYAERLNKRLARSEDSDLFDTSKDAELAQVVMLLCESALDSDERAMPPTKADVNSPRRPRVSG
jgi:hypothetical protein